MTFQMYETVQALMQFYVILSLVYVFLLVFQFSTFLTLCDR